MRRQEGAEGLDGFLAVAWDGKDHRLPLALHVEKHRHVALAAPGRGFVDADGGYVAQIQLPEHAANVVVDDAPQSLIGDLQLPGDGQHRHLLDQRHGGLLEQQGEVAARPRPGHLDALDAMLRALGARHAGVQVAVMLEEIQVPPGLVGEIVSRTGLAALRAGVEAASLGLDVEIQPMGRYGSIQVLILEDPGRLQAQAEGQNLGAVHAIPPVVVEAISWPSSGGEFHTQRRRAFYQQHPLAFSVPILTNTTVPRHCKQNNYAFVFLSQATTLGVNYTATKILNKTSLMIFPSTRHQLIISIMKSMGRGTKVVSRMIYRCRDTSSFFLNIRAAPPEKCDETNI